MSNLIFVDTEFYENGETIKLISLGAVKPDGEQFYLVNKDFNYDEMVEDATARGNTETIEFLDKNVFANLNSTKQNTMPQDLIAELFETYCGESPIFWTATGSYDWVLIMQMYGIMADHPKSWPYLPMDTAQLKAMFPEVKKDFSLLPFNMPKGLEHNALYDAVETYVKYLSYQKYIEDNGINIKI